MVKCSVRFSSVAVALSLVLFALVQPASARRLKSTQKYDQSGPWWNKLPKPLLGMAYTPEPSDFSGSTNCPFPDKCKYFDDDFFNADFPMLWGSSGRDDLMTIKQMGVNFLHLYDFGVCRNHIPFLDDANSLGISVMIPISNFFVSPTQDPNRTADIQTLFNEIYGVSAGRNTPH